MNKHKTSFILMQNISLCDNKTQNKQQQLCTSVNFHAICTCQSKDMMK